MGPTMDIVIPLVIVVAVVAALLAMMMMRKKKAQPQAGYQQSPWGGPQGGQPQWDQQQYPPQGGQW
jgi:hypothetical protein